jgi:hypothetical protein
MLVGLVQAACGSRAPILSPSEQVRCSAFADSLRATLSFDQLPFAEHGGWSRYPVLPKDVRSPQRVTIHVLVRPDGQIDTTSLRIEGTTDARYRADVLRFLHRTQFDPPRVGRCAVWSRASFVTVPLGRT